MEVSCRFWAKPSPNSATSYTSDTRQCCSKKVCGLQNGPSLADTDQLATVLAQTLILSAGYASRRAPTDLGSLLKSTTYPRTISNRLAAPQNRARFLGMVVGEALAELANSGKKKLDFGMKELDTDEAKWYKGLASVSDTVGSRTALRPPADTPRKGRKTTGAGRAKGLPTPPAKETAPQATTGFVIEEVEDDESNDDGLVPYAKPDSDTEDSDEDPTTIRRDKPKAPVYIRDLIAYLRDTDNYDRQKLALTTLPALVRRKANFGTEVKEHVEELAALLVGLQDKYDLEDFHYLKLQGMLAVVVAQPKTMAPWFARAFFEGDYSTSQRTSILTALGSAVASSPDLGHRSTRLWPPFLRRGCPTGSRSCTATPARPANCRRLRSRRCPRVLWTP